MASPPGSSIARPGDNNQHAAVAVDTKDVAALTSPSASEGSGSDEEFEDDLSKNPFLDPVVAAYWKKVYDEASYECRHAFDPTLTWTEEEEKRVVRKLDFRICTWAVCI